MSEEDIRRIAREENKPFLDRIMELQDTLKDREEYCDKLEEDRENILIENIKQKEVLDKIRDKCLSIKGNPEHTIVSKNELVKQFLELLEEIE